MKNIKTITTTPAGNPFPFPAAGPAFAVSGCKLRPHFGQLKSFGPIGCEQAGQAFIPDSLPHQREVVNRVADAPRLPRIDASGNEGCHPLLAGKL
jgi:hypothetical protein